MNKKNGLHRATGKGAIRAIAAFMLLTSAAAWGTPAEDESSPEYLAYVDTTPVETRVSHRPRREDESGFCATCEFHLGVGGTYHSWRNTSSTVLPVTVTWSRNRYEFGVFRFASPQSWDNPETGTHNLLARPYWGASLTRRWRLFELGPVQAYLGFGASYKTAENVLSATKWNFAEYLALRTKSELLNSTFEFSVRHWSNGGVRAPNRGQDFAMLTVRFDR